MFAVHTDHDALKCISSPADATGLLAPWRFRLFDFDFDAIRRVVIKNQAADTLLRLQTGETNIT